MPENLSFLILPGCCVLCRNPCARRLDLCTACERDLPVIEHACTGCAIPLPGVANALLCGACLQRHPPQNATRAIFRYAYPLDNLVQRFKFHGEQAAGNVLGKLFAARALKTGEHSFTLLPVPLHPRRLRERGFNQAELLARAIGDRFHWEVRGDLLLRTRETAVQSNMSAAARRKNVRNAFALRTGHVPERIVIVDDVVTTGSTTAEIAALLRKAGAREIEVWALARTPAGY